MRGDAPPKSGLQLRERRRSRRQRLGAHRTVDADRPDHRPLRRKASSWIEPHFASSPSRRHLRSNGPVVHAMSASARRIGMRFRSIAPMMGVTPQICSCNGQSRSTRPARGGAFLHLRRSRRRACRSRRDDRDGPCGLVAIKEEAAGATAVVWRGLREELGGCERHSLESESRPPGRG